VNLINGLRKQDDGRGEKGVEEERTDATGGKGKSLKKRRVGGVTK
jgi:hypothetical protein